MNFCYYHYFIDSKQVYKTEEENLIKKERMIKRRKILSKSRSSRLLDGQHIIQSKDISEFAKFEQFTTQIIKQETFNISQLESLSENLSSPDPLKYFYALNGIKYLIEHDEEGDNLLEIIDHILTSPNTLSTLIKLNEQGNQQNVKKTANVLLREVIINIFNQDDLIIQEDGIPVLLNMLDPIKHPQATLLVIEKVFSIDILLRSGSCFFSQFPHITQRILSSNNKCRSYWTFSKSLSRYE